MSTALDELMPFVGTTVSYVAPEPLGRPALRYFATAVGDHNPLYTDDVAAAAAGYRDVIAPPTLICETNQYVTGERDHEGYIGHSWELPIPEGARQVRGGNSYVFHQEVHPDDVVTATWRIAEITEKQSRSGDCMLIVLSEAAYTNQRGEALVTNTETIIWMLA